MANWRKDNKNNYGDDIVINWDNYNDIKNRSYHNKFFKCGQNDITDVANK